MQNIQNIVQYLTENGKYAKLFEKISKSYLYNSYSENVLPACVTQC